MPTSSPRPRCVLLLSVLAACTAVERQPDEAAANTAPVPDVASPAPAAQTVARDYLPEAEDTLGHLLSRYDRDGDGAIARDEYTRHEAQFDRWDTDGDGRLTAADWEDVNPQVMPEIRSIQRERGIGRYFQSDDDNVVLRLSELSEAFAAYDGANGDGEITEREFNAQAQARRVSLPGDQSMMMQSYANDENPWFTLLRAFDEDQNGTLAIWELGIYLEEEQGGELRFDLDRCDDGAPGETFATLDRSIGVPVGQPAPDFTLPMVQGKERVTLSDHFDDTPVALIFGSYT